MDALFEIKTKIELEDCCALSKFFMKRKRIVSRIVAVVCIIEAILWLWLASYVGAIFFAILTVIMFKIDNNLAVKQAERVYKANKKFYDIEQTIKFYENKLVRESENSYTEFEYDELGKIYEAGTHFFITLPDQRSIVCIRKEICSATLREFIRKVGNDNGTYVCRDK